MNAVYREDAKFRPRCDVFCCNQRAEHYIGHGVHTHTGYRLCTVCFEKVLVDIIDHRKKTGKISKKKTGEEAWNDLDEAMDVMDREELIKMKSHKLRTYARVKFDLALQVGRTKEEWVDEILAVRGKE